MYLDQVQTYFMKYTLRHETTEKDSWRCQTIESFMCEKCMIIIILSKYILQSGVVD